MNQKKLFAGFISFIATVFAAHAQAGTPPPLEQISNALPADSNILYAMLGQMLNNPSSLYVIVQLCIAAWIIDDTPIIPSRYAKHICVLLGAGIYWMFTTPASVPHTFPHPAAVYIGNGTLCGFVAFLIHRQAVARVINLFRGNAPETQLTKSPVTGTDGK